MLSHAPDSITFNFITMLGSTQCTFTANIKYIERRRLNQLKMRSTVKRRTIERTGKGKPHWDKKTATTKTRENTRKKGNKILKNFLTKSKRKYTRNN